MVNWVQSVCTNFNFSNATLHLAIKILDNFMSDHDIEEYQLHFVGMGCILLAAKHEEKRGKVLKLFISKFFS
jgi:hypothetical protein